MRILLLEDDFVLNDLINTFLSDYYEIENVYNASDALDKIYNNKYDIFIFDINLPDMNGIDVLKEIREYLNNTPTIFISAYHDIKTLKKAFNTGACDYLKKPFELEELHIRIENICRVNYSTDIVNINENITFDPARFIIVIDNKEHQITKKENDLLTFLIKKKGQILSFDEIYSNVWRVNSPSSDTTLRTYIKNIRKILGKDSISTIYKSGYIFEL